jgi:HPr kinase/phosphorylase
VTPAGAALVLHASCVAYDGRGLLILGAAGAGKSSLALTLMAWGCALVADDRVELRPEGGRLVARAPAALAGLVEMRGVGLLRAAALPEANVVLVADLDRAEAERLPPYRQATILSLALPCLHKPATGCFAPALLQYLKAGRAEPPAPIEP